MISVDSAAAIIRENHLSPEREMRGLAQAAGSYLAEAITAPEPIPRFHNSAMDGYAVALPEREVGESEITLPVVGESRAGEPYGEPLRAGSAVRISTGAHVPDHTDFVAIVERTTEKNGQVTLHYRPEPRDNIRFRGEEVRVGDVIARKGRQVTPPMLSWLASFGITEVPVYRRPAVAILNTGEELVPYTDEPAAGQIRNSNQVFLHHFAESLGSSVVKTGMIADSLADTVDALRNVRELADIILVSGGVSVGEHDYVREAAAKAGFTEQFWRVAQKPGKPLFFATDNETLLFGLPGNPVSTAITATFYVSGAVCRLLGAGQPYLSVIPVGLDAPFARKKAKRELFLMVKQTGESRNSRPVVVPVSHQASHMISGMVESDGFIRVPQGTTRISASAELEMYQYPWEE